MNRMTKTVAWMALAGLILGGCASTDPCVNILEEKPVEPGVQMNSINIIDTSLYNELISATYCEGRRVAPTTQEAQNAGGNVVARYKVTVEQADVRRTPTGTMEVQTILRNHTNFPLQVEGRAQFFDQAKTPAEDMSGWKRVQLPPKSIGTYRVVSNKKEEANYYYIEIREGR